jgi:sarcosine oxidase
VPLVLRAVELWRELEKKIGAPIFHNCGGLDLAQPDSRIFRSSKAACEKFDIAHEILDAAETSRRFPAIKPAANMLTVYQPGSGFVLPELAITAHVNLALESGAEIHGHERVPGWESRGSSYLIRTDRSAYEARQILFSAGAWIGKLLAEQNVPVVPESTILAAHFCKAVGEVVEADEKATEEVLPNQTTILLPGRCIGSPASDRPAASRLNTDGIDFPVGITE